jgi:preprotein translocase subunit SecA
MAFKFLTKIFGSRNDRLLKNYRKLADQIGKFESGVQSLDDAALKAKTVEFKNRFAQGETLDSLMIEAFAVVREASTRVMGMRHFDVQMVGAAALHEGKIAEMRTGEGKTLTATLAVYLNAITGKGVHLVTVNDYLASRDAQWMGRLYEFLGLSVGINLPQMSRAEKQTAYAADITYGTNNEFGFDYLRDNMVYEVADRVQRGLHYAIVDEVDSILIDEARTPLIISGQADDQTEVYQVMQKLIPVLVQQIGEADPRTGEGVITPGDFTIDEKSHQIFLTDRGYENAERMMFNLGLISANTTLYDPGNISLVHHLYAALRAKHLYHRDQHYVVQQGEQGEEIVIVDEFTGRLMSGRRWGEGLHQAVEAKEGVKIQAENQTMASITFQNYFRLYGKLSGMTGTADTEAYEFQEIYGLETVVIPPNRLSKRDDQQDRVYKSTREKYVAAITDIKDCFERGQPVLVGTTSIENSELISDMLTKEVLPHQVLNAKQHAKEADIVAQAGRPKMITIATNMAGRGTDIVLGGNLEKQLQTLASQGLPEIEHAVQETRIRDEWLQAHEKVKAQGGLRIIATERHESRRIDNQLRGRSGRQGDPGASRFYLSLDDSLMRIFAGERVKAIMERLKMPDGEAIEAGIVSRSIESAQRKVEARNFDMRKQLLEYDDVANDQRKQIYQLRNEILDGLALEEQITSLREGAFTDLVRQYVPHESVEEQWDVVALQKVLHADWQMDVSLIDFVSQADVITDDEVVEYVVNAANEYYGKKVELVGQENFTNFGRSVLLQSMDTHWREHLSALDHLRQGIHLRGYAQKQPKQEYKRESFEMFGEMLDSVRDEVTKTMMTVRIQSAEQLDEASHTMDQQGAKSIHNASYTAPDESGEAQTTLSEEQAAQLNAKQPFLAGARVGRNDPCPCSSGKKFKLCHGKLA